MDAPSVLPAIGRDHTLRAELLLDVGAIPFAVELGTGKHQPDPGLVGNYLDNCRQIGAVNLRTRRAICASPVASTPPAPLSWPFLRAPLNRRAVSPSAFVNGDVVQTLQKMIQSREIGNAPSRAHGLTQLAGLVQSHRSRAKTQIVSAKAGA